MSFSELRGRRSASLCVPYSAAVGVLPGTDSRGEADNFFLCLRESRQEATRRRLKGILEKLSHFENLPDRHYPLDFRLGAYLVEDPSVDITIIQDRVRIASQQQRQSEKCTFFTQELTDA